MKACVKGNTSFHRQVLVVGHRVASAFGQSALLSASILSDDTAAVPPATAVSLLSLSPLV